MSNPANTGTIIGRLARDPKVFSNADGSKKVSFTIYADRNFKNSAGETLSDAIPVEAFVRKDVDLARTPYSSIHKGDLIAVGTSLRLDSYTRGGEKVFDLKVVAENVTFLEPRSVVQARLAERVTQAEQVNEQAKAAVPAAVAAAVQPTLTDEPPF